MIKEIEKWFDIVEDVSMHKTKEDYNRFNNALNNISDYIEVMEDNVERYLQASIEGNQNLQEKQNNLKDCLQDLKTGYGTTPDNCYYYTLTTKRAFYYIDRHLYNLINEMQKLVGIKDKK